MHTLSQILTFLKVYFGDSLLSLLASFYRGKTTDSSSAGDLSSRRESAASNSPDLKGSDEVITVPDDPTASPEPECTLDNKLGGEDLLRAAVVSDLDTLPSLPSLFKLPAPRPPVDIPASAPCKQDFGPPSNLYYDRRPLGNITNFRDFEHAKGMKLNTEVKPRKVSKSKSKSAARAPRSRSKVARSAQVPPVPPLPVVEGLPVAAVLVESAPSVHPPPVVASPQPAPGSEEWNTTKAIVLAQARKWNDQVHSSRRHSLPPPLPLDIPVPVHDELWKRHSAPPALVPVLASKRRPNLEDRLSALFKQAQDTIMALGEEKITDVVGRKRDDNVKHGNFSAIALEEGQQVFIIGEGEDEDDAETFTTSRMEQEHNQDYSLPTVNPVNPATPGLVSSISASKSMAALASASSRSLTDLLDSFDAVMTGPSWRRLLSRSDDIARRRNDSIV